MVYALPHLLTATCPCGRPVRLHHQHRRIRNMHNTQHNTIYLQLLNIRKSCKLLENVAYFAFYFFFYLKTLHLSDSCSNVSVEYKVSVSSFWSGKPVWRHRVCEDPAPAQPEDNRSFIILQIRCKCLSADFSIDIKPYNALVWRVGKRRREDCDRHRPGSRVHEVSERAVGLASHASVAIHLFVFS